MDRRTTSSGLSSSPVWEGLHEWLRGKIQDLIRELLEAEVTSCWVACVISARPSLTPLRLPKQLQQVAEADDASGTVTLRRVRVRGMEERFESPMLPLFVWRMLEVSELSAELYLHGLAEGGLRPSHKINAIVTRQGFFCHCVVVYNR